MQLCDSLSIPWHCLSLGLEWKLTFSSPVATHICWHIECSTFTASSFRIWNSSTGMPSPPLALFVVMLSKAHLTSHSRMSGSRWVITPLWLSWSNQTVIRNYKYLKNVCVDVKRPRDYVSRHNRSILPAWWRTSSSGIETVKVPIQVH